MASSPRPPDPYKTADAQASANFTAAQQNSIMQNVNEYTPYGSKTYQQIGWDPVYDSNGKMTYAPRYQSTVQLSPDQQRLLGQQTGMQYNLGNLGLQQSSRLYDHLGKEITTQGMQDWANYRRDETPTDRAAVEKAIMSRYDRDATKQNAAQIAQSYAQGLTPGSQGYGTMRQGQTDARTDALTQAYLASGEESRQAQGAYNQATDAMNNLRGGQLQERITLRNQPINEVMALLGGSGVTNPQFQPFQSAQTSPGDVQGGIWNNYQARAQNAANFNQGLFSAIGGLGSMALSPISATSMFGRLVA